MGGLPLKGESYALSLQRQPSMRLTPESRQGTACQLRDLIPKRRLAVALYWILD